MFTAVENWENDLAQAADARLVRSQHLCLPAMALCVAVVHPEQLRREERGLLPARAGADLDDYGLVVVRVAR